MLNSLATSLLVYPEAIQDRTCFSLAVKQDTVGFDETLDEDRFSIISLFNVVLEYHISPFKTARIPLLIKGSESL